MRPRRLIVLAVYPSSQAGTRLRGEQFLPALQEAGLTTHVWSLFTETASERWFSARTPSHRLVAVLACLPQLVRLTGLLGLLRPVDVVVVLREALPLATAAVERWVAARCCLVWDVDDAIWVDHPGLLGQGRRPWWRGGEKKYRRVAGSAHEIWAGSEVLAQWCRRSGTPVWVLPTVVALPSGTPGRVERQGVGWIGSSSTAPFLAEVLPALVGLTDRVRVVGAELDGPDEGPAVAWRPWSQLAEDELLRSVRVGLYPIATDHPLAEGKAGLKAVLYMAHGLPCVVTPTRTVGELVQAGAQGLHARTHAEWRDAVQRLCDDDDLWDLLAQRARDRAREFSLQLWAPRVVDRVTALGRRRP